MFHKVVQVVPTDDFKVYIYFADGKIKIFDASELITKGVFTKIQDINIFKNTCTVLNDTLAWDIAGNFDASACLDLDPEELYNSCLDIEERSIFSA